VVDFAYSVFYVDLMARSVPFSFPSAYTSTYSTYVYSKYAPATGKWHLVLDYSSTDAAVTQILMNATNVTSIAVSVVPISLESSSSTDEMLLGTQLGGSTFLFSANGTLKWGITTPIYSVTTVITFTPLLVDAGPNGRPIVINQFSPRGFYAFDADNGTLVYQGFLPLCVGGQGSRLVDNVAVNPTAVTTDAVNGLVYFSVINSCLYALNTRTGAVSHGVVKGGVPLLPLLITTPHCIVALDTFGGIWCYPRGATLSVNAVWTVAFGYAADVADITIKYFGDFLLANVGTELVCISEATGVVVWRIDLGPRLTFCTYNASSVIARTWNGVFVVNVDPALPATKRIASMISATTLFGAPYTDPTLAGALIDPIVTQNGVIVVIYDTSLVGISLHRMAVVFTGTTDIGVSALKYSPTQGLNRVFVVESGMARLHSVVDGSVLAAVNLEAASGSGVKTYALPKQQMFVFANVGDEGTFSQLQPIPQFVKDTVPDFVPNTTVPPTPFTTSPGYVPQGGQTPLPTLAPGVTLPHLSCVLNIEALYADLVVCVNGALTQIYANRSVDAILCMSAAEKMRPCVANWLDNVMPVCAGADIYLNNVLTALNSSTTFNFCGHANRCSDGAAGAQSVCSVVNAAMQPSGGATFAPQLQLPKPIANLPTFTVPSNTITLPPTTTTRAPVTTQSPQTTTPQHSTTASPTSVHTTTAVPGAPTTTTTAIPVTTTTSTPVTTIAPVPTTTFAPTQEFMFRCELPSGHVSPPANFALLVGGQIGLTNSAPIEISEVIVSQVIGRRTVGDDASSAVFTFVFVGDSAVLYSQQLDVKVVSNSAAVAQGLGLNSIAAETYTPQGSSPAEGIGAGAVAGIIVTVLVVAAIVGVVGFRYHRQSRGQGRSRALRGSMIQEDGGYGGTGTGAVLSKREMGDLDDGSTAPIHSAM
jgi:hypothetical protein